MSPCVSPDDSFRASQNFGQTLHAYTLFPRATYEGVNLSAVADAIGDSASEGLCSGLSSTILQRVTGGNDLDLRSAAHGLLDDLQSPERRVEAARLIRQNDRPSAWLDHAPENTGGRELHIGGISRSADRLIDDLRGRFAGPQLSGDGRSSENQSLAVVNLSHAAGAGQTPVLIQQQRSSDSYLTDGYQLFEPHVGVVMYDSFESLATGLRNVFQRAYPEQGGVRRATTYYYGDRSSRVSLPGAAASHDPSGAFAMHDLIRGAAGGALVPPDAHLPPPPPFDMPGPFGYIDGSQRGDLRKRALHDPQVQPRALFRPSTTAPDTLKRRNGFYTDSSLENVSLDLHNYKMSANPAAIDGGGYLGSFYDRNIAQAHLKEMGDSGFIYYVAPSPNMVDTAGSLGREHTRNAQPVSHDVLEAAAMGWIGWTQVRGWQQVDKGKLGDYQANPEYRWDIYDKTRTSGARPELAGFSFTNGAWADADHAPFVKPISTDGKTRYEPDEDPLATTVRFLTQARTTLKEADTEQTHHNEYPGPITVKPLWANNRGTGSVRLTFRNGYPSVNRWKGNSDDRFYFGTDGRMHATRNYDSVLRIDGKGNAYVGSIPTSPDDLNGVFQYQAQGINGGR